VKGDIEGIRFESVLLTLLEPKQDEKDNSVQAFHHSGYGQGQRLVLSKLSIFLYEDTAKSDEGLSKIQKKQKRKVAIIEVYDTDVSCPDHDQGVPVCSLPYHLFAGFHIIGIH
jgi:hypothetical protein